MNAFQKIVKKLQITRKTHFFKFSKPKLLEVIQLLINKINISIYDHPLKTEKSINVFNITK